jgi:hypothetical protein
MIWQILQTWMWVLVSTASVRFSMLRRWLSTVFTLSYSLAAIAFELPSTAIMFNMAISREDEMSCSISWSLLE